MIARSTITLLFSWAASLLTIQAQNFAIDWFTVDGGGGRSSGGIFSISGTVGQPDAGVQSGASYSVVGGFWSSAAAVQTVGAPLLSIERLNDGHVRVFWPLPATGFVLDVTSGLASAPGAISWTEAPFPYETNSTHIAVTVTPSPGHRFYRLRKL